MVTISSGIRSIRRVAIDLDDFIVVLRFVSDLVLVVPFKLNRFRRLDKHIAYAQNNDAIAALAARRGRSTAATAAAKAVSAVLCRFFI